MSRAVSILSRWASAYCIAAGAVDALTGVLLVWAPLLTLRLMGIPVLPEEPVYLRFVGAFVTGVGLSYLFPFAYRDSARRWRTLAVVLEVTAMVRLVIAVFVSSAIAGGELTPGWLSVAATDLILGVVQLVMVRRRVFGSVASAEEAQG